MLVKVGIGLLGILAVLAAAIAMQPDDFKVGRSTQIAAPPEKLFTYLNDLHNWEAWSPWAKLDPNMKADYSGSPAGVGASYHWVGNSTVGEGRMTITNAQPVNRIDIKLEFVKPFESNSMVAFLIQPANNGSTVEWQMSGKNSFIEKGFCLFMGGMDKMIGPDFEKGLAQLKTVSEKN